MILSISSRWPINGGYAPAAAIFNDLREMLPANPSVFLQMQTVPLEAAHVENGLVLFPIPPFDLALAFPRGLNPGVRFGGWGLINLTLSSRQ